MRGYAAEWSDGYGRSRWQPLTQSGERLWHVSNYADAMHQSWWIPTPESSEYLAVHGPVTYKSRARAERIARRRQARREAEELRKIHPVQNKEADR